MLFLQISITLLIFIIMSIQARVVKNLKRIQTKGVTLDNDNLPEFYNNSNYKTNDKKLNTWNQYDSNGIHNEHIKRWNYYKNAKKIFLWSNGIIPFIIGIELNAEEKKVIQEVMDDFHTKTCIMFRKKKPTDQDYIEFKKSNYGCWTFIGRMRGRNLVELDSSCIKNRSYLLHQLMHVIGFFDQHNAKNREKWIKIIWPNIQIDKRQYFDIPKSRLTEVEFPYDYQSIMHLNMYSYSNNQKETMISKVSPMNFLGPTNDNFTSIDLFKVNKFYEKECKSRFENIINEINGIYENNSINNINGSIFDKSDYKYKRNNEINYLQEDDNIHNSTYDYQESYYEKNENKRQSKLAKKNKSNNDKVVPHMICVIWPVSLDTSNTRKK